jgi:hypothetical protein
MKSGASLPHFEVTTIDGRTVTYSDIWQRRNLLLVVLPAEDPAAAAYAAMLRLRASDITAHGAECVITNEPVALLSPPALVVADRWGEVAVAMSASSVGELPGPEAVLDWLEHLQHKCPECEGEAR